MNAESIKQLRNLLGEWREMADEYICMLPHLGYPEAAITEQEAKTYLSCAAELEEYLDTMENK